MATTWRTDAQTIVNNVGNTLSNVWTKTTDMFKTGFKNDIDQASTYFKNGVNVVGINVGGIQNMKDAIDDYVTAVYEALDALSSADSSIAFAGDYKAAIDDYILACIEACDCIVSNMLEFQDELTKVENAYKEKDANIKSAINKDAESTRSAYTMYGGSSAK